MAVRTEAVINAKEKRQHKQLRKKGVQDLHFLFALSENSERKKRLQSGGNYSIIAI